MPSSAGRDDDDNELRTAYLQSVLQLALYFDGMDPYLMPLRFEVTGVVHWYLFGLLFVVDFQAFANLDHRRDATISRFDLVLQLLDER